jgi:hypothetical protein
MAASPSPDGREVTMWSEWLARTLKPHRPDEEAAPAQAPRFVALPDLECDGLHPGADEFRSALDERIEAPSP